MIEMNSSTSNSYQRDVCHKRSRFVNLQVEYKKYLLQRIGVILFIVCFCGMIVNNYLNIVAVTVQRRGERVGFQSFSVDLAKSNSTTDDAVASSASLGNNKFPERSNVSTTSTYDDGETKMVPRNLRLAFIGDSITRYMYLSLAHYLRWGFWETNETIPSIVVEKQYGSWNAYYNHSKQKLSPYEECDCWRNTTKTTNYSRVYENRYYWDPHLNNSLMYIQKFGKFSVKGHWNPNHVHWKHDLDAEYDPNFAWNFQTSWADIVSYHLAKLPRKPQYLIFNAGLWPDHGLNCSETLQSILDALKENDIIGIYRTTSLLRHGKRLDLKPPPKQGIRRKEEKGVKKGKKKVTRTPGKKNITNSRHSPYSDHDGRLCSEVQYCLNVSWIEHIPLNFYWDTMHFYSPIYTQMNTQLLNLLDGIDYKTVENIFM